MFATVTHLTSYRVEFTHTPAYGAPPVPVVAVVTVPQQTTPEATYTAMERRLLERCSRARMCGVAVTLVMEIMPITKGGDVQFVNPAGSPAAYTVHVQQRVRLTMPEDIALAVAARQAMHNAGWVNLGEGEWQATAASEPLPLHTLTACKVPTLEEVRRVVLG